MVGGGTDAEETRGCVEAGGGAAEEETAGEGGHMVATAPRTRLTIFACALSSVKPALACTAGWKMGSVWGANRDSSFTRLLSLGVTVP